MINSFIVLPFTILKTEENQNYDANYHNQKKNAHKECVTAELTS